jgi:hypothetical protein
MTKSEYDLRIDELFSRWKQARPEYDNESEDKRFSLDGIEDYDQWSKSKPKIVFLLKENCASDDNWEPRERIDRDANDFSLNIIRWRQLLIDLYNKSLNEPSFSYAELPKYVNDIALIEVKKLNERKNNSTPADLRQYAINDKDFIKEQIALLNPNIILCCNTATFYGRDIYGDEHWECLIQDSSCKCFKHGNRLVIDFYHPSIWWGAEEGRDRELFDILHRMITNGNIFENFNWE